MCKFQEIVEQYRDPSGKYVYRIKISDSETMFVSFTEEPTIEKIIHTVNLKIAQSKGNGMKVNINTQVEVVEFPVKIQLNDETITNPNIEQLLEAGWRYQVPLPEIDSNHYYINKKWVQCDDNPNMAVCQFDTIVDEENELQWQANKPQALKVIENAYIDFLTTDWSNILKEYSLIPADHTITVENTDEVTNIGLLLQLRNLDKVAYSYHSNEFLKFKTMILELGGIMAKVKFHELN